MRENKFRIIQDDPWLIPYEQDINMRYQIYQERLNAIRKKYTSLKKFASMHHYLGFNYSAEEKGWYYREWAPAAYALHLIGEFNHWDRQLHPLEHTENGIWEIFLPDKKTPLTHESLLKVIVTTHKGSSDRLPAYIKRAVQDPETQLFSGQHWHPHKPFQWTDQHFDCRINELIIYEAHVGMAQEKAGIGSYRKFAEYNLPRIADNGYNAIQLMAIQEHPYYGSFGYHVSNFFAPSSRFGTPEDLKCLVNKAHNMGIVVIMDIVHAHAVKNIHEGLNEFDGTDYQYFHSGGKGEHFAWDSKLFHYGKEEVMAFLLSNIRYWLEEFHFDGFRFDGVTSMMYTHHGHTMFDHYDKYFKYDLDTEAITYLQLANTLMQRIKPGTWSIAEDVSGMPGLCRPITEGGMGFTHRLGMGIPNYWIKLLKEQRDEDWNIEEMLHTMTNRRYKEKTVAYCESHDQALVGDKTIAFWLMDKEMYKYMQTSDRNIIIDRGIALHKMIRFFTIVTGGESYLNFIGNEFGHPEWVDFPREGNNWSYHYARRQWSLADHKKLKYQYLYAFDKNMIHFVKKYSLLKADTPLKVLNMDIVNKTVIFEKKALIFIFNFHPNHAIPDYEFYAPQDGTYQLVFNSDVPEFGGYNRVDSRVLYQAKNNRVKIYNINRSVLVLRKQSLSVKN